MYTMSVCGEKVEFLVDYYYYYHSVLHSHPEIPANIRRYTHTVSAIGHVQRDNFTIPLS